MDSWRISEQVQNQKKHLRKRHKEHIKNAFHAFIIRHKRTNKRISLLNMHQKKLFQVKYQKHKTKISDKNNLSAK